MLASHTTSKLHFDFGPKTAFPFSFTMTAGAVGANKDYILNISNSHVGQIDVAKAGVRLGALNMPSTKPLLASMRRLALRRWQLQLQYAYPGKDGVDWAAAQGFGIIRDRFSFQNIQSSSAAPLNEAAMRQLDPVLNDVQPSASFVSGHAQLRQLLPR